MVPPSILYHHLITARQLIFHHPQFPPIIIINMSSNSIPLQSMSTWSLDSGDYHAHVNLCDQLYSQHPQCEGNTDDEATTKRYPRR